ncbi:BatA domain-containing protein [Planctomycetota bacterium]
MSFLFPLFLAGIAAISLPIILHMIRRHTRKYVTFSSLMFLHTTMPRFRNRSKLENLPLLLLRCLILILLAFAFSRPFLIKPTEDIPATLGSRIVLLIDTSASMQREGMWEQAIEQAQSVLDEIELTDRLCVINFGKNTETLIGFESWSEMEPDQRIVTIEEGISQLSPTWASTNLGNALITAAEAIEDDEINDQQPMGKRQVILISDIQQGSDISTLQSYQWPSNTELVVKKISARNSTNAAMQIIINQDYVARSDDSETNRIRVINSADAISENFQLAWAEDDPVRASSTPIDVYVSPGNSIVSNLPTDPNGQLGQKLVITGDGHIFDNTFYLSPNLEQQANIIYIGDDLPGDSGEMLYYVQRAFQPTHLVTPEITVYPAETTLDEKEVGMASLIIVADTIKQESIELLREQIESGGTAMVVMKSIDTAGMIAALAGLENLNAQEAEVDEYAMLGSIDFEHPLFLPFSGPQYGDFTKISFWKYRQINIEDLPDARALALFDNGDPAFIELPVGDGTLLIFTSGWQPSDSQLARSSKFVPLLYSILEYKGILDGQQAQYFVGDSIRLPQTITNESGSIRIRKPNNTVVEIEPEQQYFTQTEIPGIYNIESGESNKLFAVNISIQESRTAPLPIEEFEQLGISMEGNPNISEEQTQLVKEYSNMVELEYQQKLWRWVFVAIFIVLVLETWLAGWLIRPHTSAKGEEND